MFDRFEWYTSKWKETEKIAEKEGCDIIVVPRKKKMPEKLGGDRTGNYQTASDFYSQNVYFPILDTLINEITYRFQENYLIVFMHLSLIHI